MKKVVIGYIFSDTKLSDDEKIFLKLAKDKNVEIILFDVPKELERRDIEKDVKKCDIFFNSSAEEYALEFAKTIESIGKKVIDPTKKFYYIEDKWLFFLKCKEHKIPVIDTIMLSNNLTIAKKELRMFDHWPVILKRIYGCQGEFVGRAKNLEEAVKMVIGFWNKGNEKLPIIAQEFIKSKSYRVLMIGDKIEQTVLKKSRGWKAIGTWATRHNRFKVDKELKNIVKKVMAFTKLGICGIDFLKKDGKWVVLEVNSEPTFSFIGVDKEKLINKTIDFLKKEAQKS